VNERRDGERRVRLTEAGRPERRVMERRRRDRRSAQRQFEPILRGEYERRHSRLVLLFLALAAIASGSAYLGWHANDHATRGLADNAAEATYGTCVSGGELRLATAAGLDELRTLALNARVPRRVRDEFIARTQPAIDELLSQAVGYPFRAPLPPGAVTRPVRESVERAHVARCRKRVARTFG
jgi:hypothetical protein